MRVISNLRRLPVHASSLVIAVGASAPSPSGRVMGGFTLPVAAEWGRHSLPAGDYTFVVPSAASRAWVYLKHGDDAFVLFAASAGPASRGPMNELRLNYDGRGYHVRSLKLRGAEKVFFFDTARPEPPALAARTWSGVLSILLGPFAGPREIILTLRP